MNEPLHPETYRTLEQLVKLHGRMKLIAAINEIAERDFKSTEKGDAR